MRIKGKEPKILARLLGGRSEELALVLFFPGAIFAAVLVVLLGRSRDVPVPPGETEEIFITIEKKHFKKLEDIKARTAETGGVLVTTDVSHHFVPAIIEHEGESIRVRLRLKGNDRRSREGSKLALRVETKGGSTFHGMSRFSLHNPRIKSFLAEWIFHKLTAARGLISLRYDFIKVHINGEYSGIYALEEHFGKELIERNGHREGILIRFDEYWYYYESVLGAVADYGPMVYSIAHIDAFNTKRILANPSLRAQFDKARNLLEAFRRKDLPTHKVFDVKKLSSLFAITDLMGVHHALELRNIKFYYNPITSFIEPVGFDHHLGIVLSTRLVAQGRQIRTGEHEVGDLVWEDTFFEDAEFYREYLRALYRISDPEFLNDFLSRIEPEYRRLHEIIDVDTRGGYWEDDFARLRNNGAFIRAHLSPLRSLDIYVNRFEGNDLEVEIKNFQHLPVEITGYTSGGNEPSHDIPPLIVNGKIPFRLMQGRTLELKLPPALAADAAVFEKLQIEYRILGMQETRFENVHPWPSYNPAFTSEDFIRSPPNHTEFSFLLTDVTRKIIAVNPGLHTVSRSIIIPPGFTFTAREGTTLDLTDSAMILSYSPVDFVGTQDRPVRVQSYDGSGQGLAVLSAGRKSVLKFAEFLNLANPDQAGWELTGAVTFYESPVDILSSRFAQNRSEDAVNIVRSEFKIEDTVFAETSSDALDVDFSQGQIARTRFERIGNDGIDVSGSQVDIEDVDIRLAQDKALSAGERSRVRMKSSRVLNSEIAIASKDSSTIELNLVNIRGSNLALTAYQKKPEFGPASIRSIGLTLANNKVLFLLEHGSHIDINAEPVAPNARDVKSRMYGIEYGKGSE